MASEKDFPAIKIMIVDDDPSIGDLISDFLKREGHSPVIRTRPRQALNLIKEESFSLVRYILCLKIKSGMIYANIY